MWNTNMPSAQPKLLQGWPGRQGRLLPSGLLQLLLRRRLPEIEEPVVLPARPDQPRGLLRSGRLELQVRGHISFQNQMMICG